MTKRFWIAPMAVAAMVAVSAMTGVGQVMADQPAAPAAGAPAGGDKHPCHKLKKEAIAACEKAGYVKGEHKEKKGLFMDCVEPIMQGKSVANVSVDSNLVQECQAKQANKK